MSVGAVAAAVATSTSSSGNGSHWWLLVPAFLIALAYVAIHSDSIITWLEKRIKEDKNRKNKP